MRLCRCWLGERLPERPDELFRGMLLELMELRYGSASTVLCTQFKKSDWHARLGGVHADAIMDRIVHNAVWLYMGEENMRKGMAERGIRRPRPASRSRYRRLCPAMVSGPEAGKYSDKDCGSAGYNNETVSGRA